MARRGMSRLRMSDICVGLLQFWSVLVVLESLAEIAHQNMPTQNLTTEYDWALRIYSRKGCLVSESVRYQKSATILTSFGEHGQKCNKTCSLKIWPHVRMQLG